MPNFSIRNVLKSLGYGVFAIFFLGVASYWLAGIKKNIDQTTASAPVVEPKAAPVVEPKAAPVVEPKAAPVNKINVTIDGSDFTYSEGTDPMVFSQVGEDKPEAVVKLTFKNLTGEIVTFKVKAGDSGKLLESDPISLAPGDAWTTELKKVSWRAYLYMNL